MTSPTQVAGGVDQVADTDEMVIDIAQVVPLVKLEGWRLGDLVHGADEQVAMIFAAAVESAFIRSHSTRRGSMRQRSVNYLKRDNFFCRRGKLRCQHSGLANRHGHLLNRC
jgi:hypothetical protein